jgi:hypothetical protein
MHTTVLPPSATCRLTGLDARMGARDHRKSDRVKGDLATGVSADSD